MRFPEILLTACSLFVLLTLPTSNLPSYTCGPGGGEEITEVSAPRAGIGYSDIDPTPDLEVDVEIFPHPTPDTLKYTGETTVEFHSGFGYQFVDFDGTPAYYIHSIELFTGDTVSVDYADTTIYFATEDFETGWVCTFETFSETGTYNRMILLHSRIENSSGDTLALDNNIVTRVVVID